MDQQNDRVPTPVIVARADHPVSRRMISGNALKVLYRLKEGGYQAFLVGGCVRDLLIGIEPKDFDVATDASPEEMRRLFRNCRLIGRRFRLAHVRFGQQVIEVATFRAAGVPMVPRALTMQTASRTGGAAAAESEPDAEPESLDRVHDDRGRLLRDNVYGTIDQDVWRRDFTCNALYYNIEDFSIWDYVGGVEDIRARTIRLIGDPETRYREDPVRMLRGGPLRGEARIHDPRDGARAVRNAAGTPRAHSAGAAPRRIPEALPRRFRPAFLRTPARRTASSSSCFRRPRLIWQASPMACRSR